MSPDTDEVAVPPSITVASGIDALPYILLPLAGSEELDLEVSSRHVGNITPPHYPFSGSRKTTLRFAVSASNKEEGARFSTAPDPC